MNLFDLAYPNGKHPYNQIGGCCGSRWGNISSYTFSVIPSKDDKLPHPIEANYTHNLVKIDDNTFLHIYTRNS